MHKSTYVAHTKDAYEAYNSLYTVHVVLNFRSLPDKPPECLLNANDVGQRDTGLRGRDAEPRANGQDRDDECQDDTQEVQPDSKPSLIRHSKPVCPAERQ